jgi:CheY-like chemotaxis protein
VTNNTILVVEDDESIREYVKELLELEGFTVTAASNGEEGLRALRRSEPLPSLILLDVMMPVKDGFQFREEIAEDPVLGAIPVVIMTADGHIDLKRQKIGAKEAVRKPFNIDQFIEVVKRNCGSV